jgi:hypothetical protein
MTDHSAYFEERLRKELTEYLGDEAKANKLLAFVMEEAKKLSET